ncbi:unnamed protein product [Arabidopsis halleri]
MSEQSDAKALVVKPSEIIHSIAQSKESTSAWSGERLRLELFKPSWIIRSWSTKTHPCPLRESSECQEASI